MKQPFTRWTQDTETAFLLALKQTGTVRAAAAAVGRSMQSAYKRRQRLPDFAQRWEKMLEEWQAQWIAERGQNPKANSPRERWDGWSDVRKRAFLRALSETGEIRAACDRVGMAHSSVYRLKARSPEFAAACEKALARSLPVLQQVAWERAVDGWDEPIVLGGKIVGMRRRYSERLLSDLLRHELAARRAERAAEIKRGPDVPKPTSEETLNVLLARLDKIEKRKKEAAREAELAAAARGDETQHGGTLSVAGS